VSERSLFDRALAAIPAAIGFLGLLALYFWQSSQRHTPTIFTDELKWAQLSRGIAATGHAVQRGKSVSFDSLYAYAIAPAWWAHSTQTAYAIAKDIDTTLMCLTAVPVYLLARMLVSPRAATIAALGSICTSALFYAGYLLPETIAYPYFALAAYVSIRALAGAGRRWTIAAIVVDLVAIEVRSELVIVGGAFVVAASVLWVVGPRGRRFRNGWSVMDHAGVALLGVGAFVVANEIVSPHAIPWTVVTQNYQAEMWTLGLTSVSALAIGMGVLPVVAGLASLWLPERKNDPAWRAFASFTAASILLAWLYTGIKATYLWTQVYTRIEERNLIYLAPLFLVGTVVYFSSRRPWLPGVLVSLAVVADLVLHYGYQLDYPYFESPGYGITQLANREWHWPQHEMRIGLAIACGVTLGLVLLPYLRVPRIAVQGMLVLAIAATGTWMLAGEITSANGAAAGAKDGGSAGLAPNWVDQTTHGQKVTFLGQGLTPGQSTGVNILEFWNRSIANVWAIGSAPAPGPGYTLTPDLLTTDGLLSSDPGDPYVIEQNGVDVIGQAVASLPNTELVRIASHPWHLRQVQYGINYDASWITGYPPATTATGTYAYLDKASGPGVLHIDVGRLAFCQHSPGTNAVVRLGPVGLTSQRQATVAKASVVRRFHVADCTHQRLSFHVTPPVAVEVTASPLTPGSDYGLSDQRAFGVQASFAFTPDKR
jgi:hypothetical protein